jgi:MarR family transcriptional regulator, negative regulator of the multidrug operon emrRAB
MPDTHTPHDVNVIGAFALATADQMLDIGPAASAAVLVVLGQAHEGRTINSISRALRVSQSRAVRIADALEEDGLARRVPLMSDRRVVQVRLTRKGRAAAARAQRARNAVLGHTLGALSDDEVAQLAALVSKVLRASTAGHAHAEAICRLCDADGCGHHDGRCPVTAGADDREPAGGFGA